ETQLFDELDEDDPMREFLTGIADKAIGEDGVSMHELSAYSATSIFHYGRAFRSFRGMIDGKRHKVSFNMCSGLFAPVFQFYRKMDLFGVLVLLVMTLPSLLMVLLALNSESGRVSGAAYYLLNSVSTIVMILLCIFGDYIYYRHAVKRIRKIRESFKARATSDEYYMALYESGKPSFARALLGLLGTAFMEACVVLVSTMGTAGTGV
ncbi:MAG: hypothetical protein NC401_15910, partial [Ruminococcus sp.]|nr:hypothetical protein [Ruminococcus sp.]